MTPEAGPLGGLRVMQMWLNWVAVPRVSWLSSAVLKSLGNFLKALITTYLNGSFCPGLVTCAPPSCPLQIVWNSPKGGSYLPHNPVMNRYRPQGNVMHSSRTVWEFRGIKTWHICHRWLMCVSLENIFHLCNYFWSWLSLHTHWSCESCCDPSIISCGWPCWIYCSSLLV